MESSAASLQGTSRFGEHTVAASAVLILFVCLCMYAKFFLPPPQTQVGQYAPKFVGNAQHDSQELLAFLLNSLHEDLNLVRQKPYVDMTVKTKDRADNVRRVCVCVSCRTVSPQDVDLSPSLLSSPPSPSHQDVAQESWHKYLQRNQSVIVRVFQGQLKSTLVCPACKLVSTVMGWG